MLTCARLISASLLLLLQRSQRQLHSEKLGTVCLPETMWTTDVREPRQIAVDLALFASKCGGKHFGVVCIQTKLTCLKTSAAQAL